jgi:hypothetical protein
MWNWNDAPWWSPVDADFGCKVEVSWRYSVVLYLMWALAALPVAFVRSTG